ncbi:MAG: hypothetical protein PVI09_05205 [Anaerolineae bacterium]
MSRSKIFVTGLAILILSCVIWGYTSAPGGPASAWLAPSFPALARPAHDTQPALLLTATSNPTPTTTPTMAIFITPSPSPSSDPFTSPLLPSGTPGPSATSDPFVSPLATLTPTPSPTPTVMCPRATREPLWVAPVTSPTKHRSQVITVYAGNSQAITITAESGIFAVHGSFSAFQPTQIEIDLLPNTTHHLRVYSKVKIVEGYWGCVYGGYTLSTTTDRYGAPLVIERQPHLQAPHIRWLPTVFGSGPVPMP